MKCEYCGKEHDGSYGKGRFCSAYCARGFSTKAKRKQINKKVSDSLRGIKRPGTGFANPKNAKYRLNLTDEIRMKGVRKNLERLAKLSFKECSYAEKKRRILKEQQGVCLLCGINSWKGKPLILELDHINGDHSDNRRKNLRVLCPNCHSQTPTFRNRTRKITVE